MSPPSPFFSFFPQFTPDELNDKAWGEGFTDWKLIRDLPESSQANFTPARGMYDPTDPNYLSILEDDLQALSPHAGLALYHYFFDGRHVLKGFEQQLLSQRSRIPFFICWANETWSKRWIGKPNEVIVEQRHDLNESVIRDHANYLSQLFALEGYRHYDGRPLLLIYNPQASPTLNRALALYRKAFSEIGCNPFIGACISHPQPEVHMSSYDFGCEFEPRFFFNSFSQPTLAKAAARLKVASPRFFEWLGAIRDGFRQKSGQREFLYAEYLEQLESGDLERRLRECVGSRALMRSTFLLWNNTPRYRQRSTVVTHRGLYAADISKIITTIQSDDDLPLFVNSWNEWSEGAALEAGECNHPLRQVFLAALGLKP